MNKFRRHFRIYFKNNHPAYIVDEEGNLFVYHRVTHSKTSGGRKNCIKKINPIKRDNRPMRIVRNKKKIQKHDLATLKSNLKMALIYPTQK